MYGRSYISSSQRTEYSQELNPAILGINSLFGGVLKSMLTLNEAIIDVKEG